MTLDVHFISDSSIICGGGLSLNTKAPSIQSSVYEVRKDRRLMDSPI